MGDARGPGCGAGCPLGGAGTGPARDVESVLLAASGWPVLDETSAPKP